ncbi:MAG: hypothetical protein KC800_01035 [Candidatus Eremiobacteraeota bacterium]|nr:hypothetical protein [Candidatus Eremiobacteraeota bacterium]
MGDSELVDKLWNISSDPSGVDREALEQALIGLDEQQLDARTRELVFASRRALSGESTAQTGFPNLGTRIATPMKKHTIEQYLRELGTRLQTPASVVIGGSSALILQDLLSRATEDIDVVDEVPLSLREMHEWRAGARTRYGLYIAHFQSRYLPTNWEERLNSSGRLGKLEVFLIDPVDIFVGKLFSRREKDLDDLRVLGQLLERAKIDDRLEFARALSSDETRRSVAEENYYIVFGDSFPLEA